MTVSLQTESVGLKILLQTIERSPRSMIVLDHELNVIGLNRRARTVTLFQVGYPIASGTDEDVSGMEHALIQVARSALSLPVQIRHNHRIWTFNAWRVDPLPGESNHLIVLASDATNSIAARLSKVEQDRNSVSQRLAATVTERDSLRRAARRLKALSETDQLTGILNATTFMERCNAALNNPGKSGIFVFIDLNNFKPVNDQYGHDAGDHVLRTIAARFKHEIRRNDLAGRLGGDEFGLWLDDADQDNLSEMVRRIAATLEHPIEWQAPNQPAVDIHVSASYGTAFAPDDGDTAHALRRHADLEMYLHKENSKKARF